MKCWNLNVALLTKLSIIRIALQVIPSTLLETNWCFTTRPVTSMSKFNKETKFAQ